MGSIPTVSIFCSSGRLFVVQEDVEISVLATFDPWRVFTPYWKSQSRLLSVRTYSARFRKCGDGSYFYFTTTFLAHPSAIYMYLSILYQCHGLGNKLPWIVLGSGSEFACVVRHAASSKRRHPGWRLVRCSRWLLITGDISRNGKLCTPLDSSRVNETEPVYPHCDLNSLSVKVRHSLACRRDCVSSILSRPPQ